MNELDLLSRLRDEIPLAEPSAAVESIVLAELRSEGPAGPVGLDALLAGPGRGPRPATGHAGAERALGHGDGCAWQRRASLAWWPPRP